MITKNITERGQALFLLVFAFVGLLAFTALAIDGGMVFSDRRIAQNTADAAALYGAGQASLGLKAIPDPAAPDLNPGTFEGWNCNHSDVQAVLGQAEAAAIQSAIDNDFSIDYDIGDNNGVVATCFDFGTAGGKYIDVRVLITVETRSSFAHFIFGGPLVNTVEAIATVYPTTPVGQGNSIISLTSECQGNQKGTVFTGNDDVNLLGGGIHSNSCLNLNGAAGTITVTGGTVNYLDTYNDHNMTITPPPQLTTEPIEIVIDPPEDCDTLTNYGSHNSGGPILPGRYTNIRNNNGNNLVMDSGLYCLSGDFTINGGNVDGSDVTIYLDGGDFTSAGAAEVHLDAPPSDCGPSNPSPGCPPALGGMLIYAAQGDVALRGTNTSWYTGTVYAPEGLIEIGGTSSGLSEVGVQVIGNNIKIHGDVELTISYNPEDLYHKQETMFLKK